MSSLKKLAIRGGIWTIFGYGAGQTLRFGSNIILTRLLVPEMFGLMSLANIFLMGLQLFSDVGIQPSIVRHPRGEDPDFYNTAWTIQVIRGFVLWLCCLIIAYPVSQFYDEPRLLWLIPILGITTVIRGFNSTQLPLLQRRIETGKETRLQLTVQAVTITVMIIWAYFHRSVWALIVGNLTGAFLSMFWSHRLTNDLPNRLAWDQEAKKELFSFGKWIFISTAVTFLASQADRLMLGRLLSLEMLGVYSLAFFLSDVPNQVLKKLSGTVIFPVISKKIDQPRRQLRKQILEKRKWMLLFIVLGLTIAISFGDQLILFLYDDRYQAAAWMFPIMALGIWPRALAQTISKSLLAIGKPMYAAVGNSAKLIYMIVALPTMFASMGLLGAIIVIAFNDIPFYIPISFGLIKEQLSGLKQDIFITLLLILSVTVVCGIRYTLGLGYPLSLLET